eukprot:TRINITY_DN226_c0_g1_i1.p1 TRINITY_DN226_c0_g1~~TRINITY_DN226_c0_g1_i1.p1  ORF type:complete len:282 (-),score=102.15 TRINITY_DN226_c0_g1_i1:279-1124(-)
MSSDFKLAGQVVREFLSIGNVARAMVLQGMKEYSRQTFGEETLELFGEDGGSLGGSGGGHKGKNPLNLKDYPENNLEFAKLLAKKYKILVYHAGGGEEMTNKIFVQTEAKVMDESNGVSAETFKEYDVVICHTPGSFSYNDETSRLMLEYAKNGGKLIIHRAAQQDGGNYCLNKNVFEHPINPQGAVHNGSYNPGNEKDTHPILYKVGSFQEEWALQLNTNELANGAQLIGKYESGYAIGAYKYYDKGGIIISIGINHWSNDNSFRILLNSIAFSFQKQKK